MAQNWRDKYPKIVPAPAALPLPGPAGVIPGAGMATPTLPPSAFGAMPPSLGGFDPAAFPGGFESGRLLDRAPLKGQTSADQGVRPVGPTPAVQLAIDAIRNGADPKAVRARLQQMSSGNPDVDPSDPFADLALGAPQRMAGDFGPPPLEPQSTFDDQGFDARAEGANYAEGGVGTPSQPLDPGVSHQKAGDPLRLSQQKGGVGDSGPTTLSTYGLPSYPADDQSRTASPRAPAGELNRGVRWSAEQASGPVKPEPEHPNARARLRLANEAELNDPRVLAFLDTIAAAEGSDYHSLYGDNLYGVRRTFDDMLKHPGNVGRTRNGVPQSAAGRYQILRRPTYDGLLQRMGSLDMTPRSQDIMAVDLLRMSRALGALRANDFDTAVSNASGPWASLPRRVGRAWQGGRYPNQGARSIEELRAAYNRALQYYSAQGPVPANNRPPLQIRLP